jgi:hypothetical protein
MQYNLHKSKIVTDIFRKYSLLILLMAPLFIAATTIQHAVDLQNFIPESQATSSAPAAPASDILEEISTEDDIHSLIFMIKQPCTSWSRSGYIIKHSITLNKVVPTPPPDLA